ncbi:hypothetical protein [Nocardia sp. NPDC005366]|uniref:terpene synthase family protein n=1 Tax=Nocardia sp. NPDC005366 TaxID=3156878 RepID=UPI0033AF8D06
MIETMSAADVAPMLYAHADGLIDQLGVLACATGSPDWQSDGHTGHPRSNLPVNKGAALVEPTREPTGFGATAASPRLDSVRDALLAWGQEVGFHQPVPELGGVALWTPDDLRQFDFAQCSAATNPDATTEELEISAAWLAWGTYLDDYYRQVFDRRRDVAGATAQSARLPEFMPLDDQATPPPVNAMERGLADLWRRTTNELDATQRLELRTSVMSLIEGCEWDVADDAADLRATGSECCAASSNATGTRPSARSTI